MEKCRWCLDGGIVEKYHDNEWGTIIHDDKKHFEYLLMEVMQCGLSWLLMLKKREVFRNCFDNFDFHLVACYDDSKVDLILNTENMIRSRKKIEAVINNAKIFIEITKEFGSFDNYLWSFSDHKTIVYSSHQEGAWETRNYLSDMISSDMKKRGFKFLGSITVFSHLQACGMINDHEKECYKYYELLQSDHIIV